MLTFLTQNIEGFDHNGRTGAFRKWLRQVTANRVRELHRKQKRKTDGLDLGEMAEQLADDHSGLSGIWQREHNRYVLEYLLTQLADRFESNSITVFRKVMIDGRSAQDVAAEMNMTPGAVRVIQSRILRMLRELGQGFFE